jgi:hypothetical protein
MLRFIVGLLAFLAAAPTWAQQTQILWGYLAGTPSQLQFMVNGSWYPIGTFNGTSFTPSGAGTVTSVGLSAPAIFSVAGSPVTTTGVLALTLATQTANTFLAGPTAGGAATPAFRAIIPADVPLLVGDSGAGGTAGLVPAPSAGYGAAGRLLSATGAWVVPTPTSLLTDAVTQCGADPTGVADSTSAINTCLSTYGSVGLPAGTYKTTATISVPSEATLCGASFDATTISLNSTTADVVTVAANASHVKLCDLHLARVGVPTGSAAGLKTDIATIVIQSTFTNIHSEGHQFGFYLGPTDYSLLQWGISEKNYSDGFYFENNTTWNILQWNLSYVLSQKNDGWGIQVVPVNGTTNTIQGLPWVGVSTFGNTNGGIRYIGAAARPVNGITLQDCVLSYDGNNELDIQTYGGQYAKVQNCIIEGAGGLPTGRMLSTAASGVGSGIYVANGISDLLIQNNIVETNSVYGIVATGTIDTLTISGNQVIRNGVTAANTYDGINVTGTNITKLIVSDNSALNIGGTEQRYGIVVSPAATYSIVSGNNASGNTGGCSLTDASVVFGNVGTGCGGRNINSIVLSGSAVALTTATAANVTSVSLPAGDWTCSGNVNFYPAAGTTVSSIVAWIGTTSATIPTRPNSGAFTELTANLVAGGNQTIPAGEITFTIGSTTTVYLEAYTTFAVSTMGAGGFIGCRRAL